MLGFPGAERPGLEPGLEQPADEEVHLFSAGCLALDGGRVTDLDCLSVVLCVCVCVELDVDSVYDTHIGCSLIVGLSIGGGLHAD